MKISFLLAGTASVVLSAGPPMGWNSEFAFGCGQNETLVGSTAAYMKMINMDSYGYKYINLGDCWQSSAREANGTLLANTTRFPSGLTHLAQNVSAYNMSLGLY